MVSVGALFWIGLLLGRRKSEESGGAAPFQSIGIGSSGLEEKLEQSIEDMYDSIKQRLDEVCIEELADELLNDMAHFRIELMTWLIRQGHTLENITREVESLIDSEGDQAETTENQSDSKSFFFVMEQVGILNELVVQSSFTQKVDKESLISFFSSPIEDIKGSIGANIEESEPFEELFVSLLNLELGTLIYLLEREEEVILSPEKKKELGAFTLKYAELYGAWGKIIGLIESPEEDERPIVQNINILAASLAPSYTPFSLEDI